MKLICRTALVQVVLAIAPGVPVIAAALSPWEDACLCVALASRSTVRSYRVDVPAAPGELAPGTTQPCEHLQLVCFMCVSGGGEGGGKTVFVDAPAPRPIPRPAS